MMKSIRALSRNRISPRVIGFDDAPFQSRPRLRGSAVSAVGIVTSGDRFDGMLYVDNLQQDGHDAQHHLQRSVMASKFQSQIHAVLLDGVTMGGLNVIDIAFLARQVRRPVIAVMRRPPDMQAMLHALDRLPDREVRRARLRAAGPVHCVRSWVFQYRCPAGVESEAGEGEEMRQDNEDGEGEDAKEIEEQKEKEEVVEEEKEEEMEEMEEMEKEETEKEEKEETEEEEVTPEDVAQFLDMCTPTGTQKIPECLRLAHLVGAAIKTGQSSSSA